MGRVSLNTWRWQRRDETAPVWPGFHQLLGATWTPESTNFAVWSPEATAMWVCLFDDDGDEIRHQLTEHTLGVWHGAVPGVRVGQRYGFRADGPGTARSPRSTGQAAARPYAQRPGAARSAPTPGAISGATDSAATRSVVVHDDFDWEDDGPPRTRWRDTVIYELHVKGFTAAAQRGPRAPARHVRRAGQPHRDPLPQRPRRHRGRAAAGPPLLHRAGGRGPGPGQLLGLQLDRLLRAPRGLLLGRRPSASRSPSSSRW